MRRHVIALTVALIIIVPLYTSKPGHPQAQEKPTETQEEGNGKAEAGKELYVEHCQKCHGDKGQGVPRMYRLVKATVVHLGSKEAQEKSDEAIGKTMTDGFGKMEAIPELTRENIDNIVAFVRTLKLEEPKK